MSQTDEPHSLNHLFEMMSDIFFPIIIVIGVFDNVMVIMIIYKAKQMRNSTNIFLANLAISDLIFLLVSVPHALSNFRTNLIDLTVIEHSKGMCIAVTFILTMVFRASLLTILAIGFDRYYAVCLPLKATYVCTKKRAYRGSFLTWTLAALTSSPLFLLMDYQPGELINGKYYKPLCRVLADSFLEKAFPSISATAFFFIPLIILIVLFIKIARHMKSVAASKINTAAIRHRGHVVKMIATVVVCFFVCHLPNTVLELCITFVPFGVLVRWGLERFYNFAIFSSILIHLHSALNPIIYTLMSRRFRQGFKDLFFHMIHGFDNRLQCRCFRRDTTNKSTALEMNTRPTAST